MSDLIHPELVKPGKVMKLIFRPNKTMLRFFNRGAKKQLGAELDGFENATHYVDRTRGDGAVRVRVYGPKDNQEQLPVLLYFHGGGYAIGSPEGSHAEITRFLKACPCIIVAPDYTKSFVAPYPAAIDDCEDTLDWMLANAEPLGIRTDKVIVGGHSAGGGLTVCLLERLRERADVAIAFQMPIYPMLNHLSNTPSASNNVMPVWSTKHNKLAWKMYLGDLADSNAVPTDAAPAQLTDLSGFPPAATYVGNLDPFHDETQQYVELLEKSGVAVESKVYEGCYHAFDVAAPNAPPSVDAIQFMQDQFVTATEKYTAPQPITDT